LRLAVNHRLPGTGWSLGGSVRLQSKIYNDATSWSPLIRQDGYALADLTAKHAINPKADLLLAVNNLFDKRYYASVYGAMYVPYGEPRKVSATLKYYF
jgi:outer membrane receptor for ferric coprogen and ferric-rhodotorulic acid